MVGKNRQGSRSGFTVVEVMVAMIVLSVALLGMLSATAMTVRVIGESDRAVAAAYYVNERLESLEALGCDQASGGNDVRDGIYSLSWTVSGTADSSSRAITMLVKYPLSTGRVSYDTYEKSLPCVR